MEQQQNSAVGIFEKNKMLLKGLFIGFLILVMLIPVAYLINLIREREIRQNEVIDEISSKWASAQNIQGPVIIVPYIVPATEKEPEQKHHIYLLPEKLDVNGAMLPEVRQRSLYQVTLYRSEMTLAGNFDFSALDKMGLPRERILWNECSLILGLDDSRGLEENVALDWGSSKMTMDAGVPNNQVVKNGLNVKVSLDTQESTAFQIRVKLKGSEYLYFTPVGKTTQVSLNSPWQHPSFDGQYLPYEKVNITDKGFTARWKVLQVSRNYPQIWTDETAKYEIANSAFGVKLIQPTDGYSKTDRSVKYAILIIALTFTVFFFIEIFQKKQVHPLQYILVGIALCVFYTLLLSISEYTGFNPAYLIATVATVSLISLYVWGIFKQLKIAAGLALALGGLYTYIFILIQLQDYALLCGSIGLFIILAVIMYYSRKIDWYHTGQVK